MNNIPTSKFQRGKIVAKSATKIAIKKAALFTKKRDNKQKIDSKYYLKIYLY